MASAWSRLQSTVRSKQGHSPPLELEVEYLADGSYGEVEDGTLEKTEEPASSPIRTPVKPGQSALAPRTSIRNSVALSRAASPQQFAKAVELHNDRLSRASSRSSKTSFGESDHEGENRVRAGIMNVVAKGRGSGLLPSEDAVLSRRGSAEGPLETSAKGLPAVPQASLGKLMSVMKLKKTVVPKLAAAARMRNRALKRSSRGSVTQAFAAPMGAPSGARASFVPVPTSLHLSSMQAMTDRDQSSVSPVAGGMRSPLQTLQEGSKLAGGENPNAAKSLMIMSKARKAGRLFLRLAGPGARLAFLKAHPFFKGASESLIERLAPQLVKRSVEQVSSEVLVQGEEPTGATDYLFLTSPDFGSNIEVTLDNYPIAALSGDAVFGQEAVFGITKAFAFGIRVPEDHIAALWVIPRKTLAGLLVKPVFHEDSQLLKERAHNTAVALLRAWYLHPISHVKIRLFDNAEHAFKHRMVQAVDMRLVASGSPVCTEQDTWSTCFCVFRGEAHVKVAGAMLARLAHTPGTSAWAAWWGTLEILGIVEKSPATVVAVTDCIVWQLPQDRLMRLRQEYPMECRLFDKVAVEHMRALQPFAMNIRDSPHLRNCETRFLHELDTQCEKRIYSAGHVVIHEGTVAGDEIYVLVRGKAEVRKSLCSVTARSRNASPTTQTDKGGSDNPALSFNVMSTVPVATLQEGQMFGEIAALGVKERRTATVVCSTICDIRVVKSVNMVQALTHFPEQGMILERLSANHTSKNDNEVLDADMLASDGLFSDFSTDFLEKLGGSLSALTAFSGQPIIEQGAEVNAMFVLTQGKVAIEIESARLCDLRAPAVIGEMCLLDAGMKSSYTVRSRTHCHFKLIAADRGRAILESFPADQEQLGIFCSERLEKLRMEVCRKYHGVRPSELAERQAAMSGHIDFEEDDDSSAEGKAPDDWWVDTIFKESDREFIDFLSESLKKKIYFHDEVILREGDEGDSAIILQVGGGVVEVGGVRVGEVKAGSIVGEAVLLGYATLRTATVRAVGLTSAVSLSRSCVLEALQSHPEEMQRVEHMMMIRSSTNKLLTKNQAPAQGCSINIGGIQMGVMGGSAIKTMKMMAVRRSTTTLNAHEIQTKLKGDRPGSRRTSAVNEGEGPEEDPRNFPCRHKLQQRMSIAIKSMPRRFGSRTCSPAPGSRMGSCVGSRVGSRVGTPIASRQASPTRKSPASGRGSDDSSSDEDDPARSRLASLRTAMPVFTTSGGRMSRSRGSQPARASPNSESRRSVRASSRQSVDGCAKSSQAPLLLSDLRSAARKLKKEAPSISVNCHEDDGEHDIVMKPAMSEAEHLRHEKIAGIAAMMLQAPLSPQARPLTATGGEEKKEALLTPGERKTMTKPRSSSVLAVNQAGVSVKAEAVSIKAEDAGSKNNSNMGGALPASCENKMEGTKPGSFEYSAPDLPVDTDIEMNAEDLKSNQRLSDGRMETPPSFMDETGDPEVEDFLNLDDADLDCEIDDNAMRHNMILVEPHFAYQSKESGDWVEKRKRMMEAAPMRQKLRLARRGDFLPLVPENKGYQGDISVLHSGAVKTAARRYGRGPSGATHRLLRAQGVYLSARRWDVRRK